MIDDKIQQHINSLIVRLRAQGIEALQTTKLLVFINERFGMELDEQSLEEILSKNTSVSEIIDDKIILGTPEANIDNDTTDDEIHDMAVDQSMDHFESYNKIKKGDIISSRSIQLDETNEYYLLHKGLRNSNVDYEIVDIKPCLKITESMVVCKVKNRNIMLEIPLTTIK